MKVEVYETPKDGKAIRLLEPLRISVKGREYVVPEGYCSNGFSCPRFLWSLISPAIDNRTLKSACGHDWLYEYHVVSREEADQWFRDSLIGAGVPRIKAYAIYLAVRVFGGRHYKRK